MGILKRKLRRGTLDEALVRSVAGVCHVEPECAATVPLPAEQVAAANGYGCHASCCAGDHASRSRG
jgi:hypothetical protein